MEYICFWKYYYSNLFVKVYFMDWLEIDVRVVANRTVGCDGGESMQSTQEQLSSR
jgi:hypothetical protein